MGWRYSKQTAQIRAQYGDKNGRGDNANSAIGAA